MTIQFIFSIFATDNLFNNLKLDFMAKMLVVKLLVKGSGKSLFERDIMLGDNVTLDNFPFSSVIDSLVLTHEAVTLFTSHTY